MNSEDREADYGNYLRTRGRKLRIDLNVLSINNQEPEETSVNSRMQIEPMSNQRGNRAPTIIDLDAISDDVIILSPRSFAEARNNSRRNHGRPVVGDLNSEYRAARTNINKHGRSSHQTCVNCDLSLTPGGSSCSKKDDCSIAPAPSPLTKPPSYCCPVCLGSLVEETSTKCGHIFCSKCIKAAIKTNNKCPTCRKGVHVKDLIRVYLPVTS